MSALNDWHAWYAWHPVDVYVGDGAFTWAWCTMVERREYTGYAGEWGYEYRFPKHAKTRDEGFTDW